MKTKNLFIIYAILMFHLLLINNKEQQIVKPVEQFNFKMECSNQLVDYNTKLEQISQEYEKELRQKAFLLLNDYVGKKGDDCYKVAIRFVRNLKEIDNYKLVRIKAEEVKCGDLIFYKNNGMGQTHWAVYLDEEIALQGKGTLKGINIIGKVNYEKFSKPVYYRVEERKK